MAILHEQTGLQIRKNERNKFTVVRLHYTADPAKRSPEWKEEAKAGMREADFLKEYEIVWDALSGEHVFPEIREAKDTIIVREPYPEFGDDAVYWGGLDYGARNPSSCHFYTIYDGVLYCVWELYEPCIDVEKFVGQMCEFPHYSRVKWIAADPSMFNKTTRNAQGLPCSPYELFTKAGCGKLLKAHNDEQVWLMQMREHWANAEDPTFRVFELCSKIISEFEGALFEVIGEKASRTHNLSESMVDRHNHAMDDCKYLMSMRPKANVFSKVRWPRMVDRYKPR